MCYIYKFLQLLRRTITAKMKKIYFSGFTDSKCRDVQFKNSNIFLKEYSLLRNAEFGVHAHFFTPSHLVHQQVPSASRFSGQLYSIITFSCESSNLSLLSTIQFYDIVYDIVKRNSVLTIR